MVSRAPRRFPSSTRTWPRLLLAAAVILYAVYFSWLTVTRFAAFESRALDMGNLHQAIWNTAQGNWFHQTNQPGSVNRLSLHVEPILLPIAAWYRLFPGVEALLVLQSVIVALGAVPLYAIGEKRLRSPWLALILALSWLLMPAMQAANVLEFHPLTLAPTFLIAAFYFLLEKRAGWYVLFAVLAAASKEEMGLLVAMIGLYALVALRMRWTGILTIALGVGWSLIAVLGIQQQFGGNIHWGRYDWLGETRGAMVRTLVMQPAAVVEQLQKAQAGQYFFELLLPVGFLSLVAPEVLLLALPSLAINLLADFPPMHQVDGLIYAAPIAPFVALAAVLGAARLLRRLRRGERASDTPSALARYSPWAIGLIVAGGAIAAQALWGYLPGGGNFKRYTVTEHDRRAAALIERIAPQDRVSAQDRLDPHVAGRESVYLFPELGNGDEPPANVVFLDVSGPSWPIHPNDVRARVQELLADGWGIDAADDGYLLLREGITNTVLPAGFFSPWQAETEGSSVSDPGSEPIAVSARFGEEIEVVGADVETDANGEVVVRLEVRARQELETNLVPRLIARSAAGELLYDSLFSPPVASLWYPSTMWRPGDTIAVAALPWTPEADRLTLYLGVYPEGQPEAPLPVRSWESSQRVLEGGTLLRLGGFEKAGETWRAQGNPAGAAGGLDVRFGEVVALDGASVAVAGTPVSTATVTLQGRTITTPTVDYQLFIHVLDGGGNKVAQWDGPPRDHLGELPVRAWPAGERIVGSYAVALPPELPSGEYSVVVGFYDWRDGVRLAAAGAGSQPDGSARVGSFTVP